MLTIPLEKLAFIIIKAREYDAEVPSVDEDSGSNPSDDADRGVLEENPGNPTLQELVDALNGLSELERIEVLALTWLGRGEYSKEEWRDALMESRRVHDAKETDYLVGTPLLADYLEEGLSQLGYSIEDYEIGRL
ncbi:MAG TPA: DUF3775 domain-containing protein [Stellaceae bacterium]|nr:DUF3775 domain-containing protein [Stellaceae bacterium]